MIPPCPDKGFDLARGVTSVLRLSVLVPLLLADAARAAPDCADMAETARQARANFAIDPVPALPGAQFCQVSLSISGARALTCAWPFAFRDQAAGAEFESITAMLHGCAEVKTSLQDEPGVNHPDTYLQRHFLWDQVPVSLSLKDKSALHETYVFVTVQGLVTN